MDSSTLFTRRSAGVVDSRCHVRLCIYCLLSSRVIATSEAARGAAADRRRVDFFIKIVAENVSASPYGIARNMRWKVIMLPSSLCLESI